MKELQASSKPLCSSLGRDDAYFQHAFRFKGKHLWLLHKPHVFISEKNPLLPADLSRRLFFTFRGKIKREGPKEQLFFKKTLKAFLTSILYLLN